MSDNGRPIHDCPDCGRTKFADETLPCCVDEEFERLSPESKAQVERAMRSYERRCKRERMQPKWDRGLGMYIDDVERFSQ